MAEEAKKESCWDAVDAVVCINLDHRKDRWESFGRAVYGVIPEGKLHRERAVLGTTIAGYGQPPWFTEHTVDRNAHWAGTAGCLLSHRNVIRRAVREGWRNVLIFEDDVVSYATAEGLELLGETIRKMGQDGAYLLYLGYTGRAVCGRLVAQRGESSVLQVDGVGSTHAYLIGGGMYGRLLTALPQEDADAWEWLASHRAIDAFYCNELGWQRGVRFYAMRPQLYRQSGSPSDILLGKKYTLGETEVHVLNRSLYSLCRMMRYPYARLKATLNSCRTYRRALRGGFPGYRKKK